MLLHGGSNFELVAFVDDKRTLQYSHINGVTVSRRPSCSDSSATPT